MIDYRKILFFCYISFISCLISTNQYLCFLISFSYLKIINALQIASWTRHELIIIISWISCFTFYLFNIAYNDSRPHFTEYYQYVRLYSILKMVNIFRILLQHVKEYCEEAAIHGPQHIVSPRLAIFERLALITSIENKLWYISLCHSFQFANTKQTIFY